MLIRPVDKYVYNTKQAYNFAEILANFDKYLLNVDILYTIDYLLEIDIISKESTKLPFYLTDDGYKEFKNLYEEFKEEKKKIKKKRYVMFEKVYNCTEHTYDDVKMDLDDTLKSITSDFMYINECCLSFFKEKNKKPE